MTPKPRPSISLKTQLLIVAACLMGAAALQAQYAATDVNRDGLVNVVDVQTVVNIILATGTQAYPGQGDVNTDGLVNVVDVQLVVNWILSPPQTDVWEQMSQVGDVPSSRFQHSAVWTGSELIVWGGNAPGAVQLETLNTGSRYNLQTKSWSATSQVGAPTARADHTAIWTGSKMIIWGGLLNHADATNTGGIYDPVSDTWTAISLVGAPFARYQQRAVWTGSRMIIWGGRINYSSAVNTGGIYDPETDSWTPTNTVGAPDGTANGTSVWTGSKMVVWGGETNTGLSTAGGMYDPMLDSWVTINSMWQPSPRSRHTAVWTGTQMIIWGGWGGWSGPYQQLSDGVAFDPSLNEWVADVGGSNAPSACYDHTAVWTGSRMIVWGGDGNAIFGNGASYDPVTYTWKSIDNTTAPVARQWHTASWSGNFMIVWGGWTPTGAANDGSVYTPD